MNRRASLPELQAALPQRKTDYSVSCSPFAYLVGVAGFELATPCTPCKSRFVYQDPSLFENSHLSIINQRVTCNLLI